MTAEECESCICLSHPARAGCSFHMSWGGKLDHLFHSTSSKRTLLSPVL